MNIVRDFIEDPVRLEDKLSFDSEIRTASGYMVNTIDPVWITPPRCPNFAWGDFEGMGVLLSVHKAYVASLLSGRSEGTARAGYVALLEVSKRGGWQEIENQWLNNGEIEFSAMISLRQYFTNPKRAEEDFAYIKRWYYWSCGIGIPGFSAETADKLKAMRGYRKPSFFAIQKIVPGAPRSKASRNRYCYTNADFHRIQSAMLGVEARLGKGEIILSTGRDFSLLPLRTQVSIKKHSLSIGTRHLVLGWLACQFGDRPKAYCVLRESDFEFHEADGVVVGTVRFSDEVKRGYGRLIKPAKRPKLPLNGDLVRLVPKLLMENRAWAAAQGINPDCDLPLFPVKRFFRGDPANMRMTVEDEGARRFQYSGPLASSLRDLFKVLKVKRSDGQEIIPTFYSFRDGNHTAWARRMPLESVRVITGKKRIESLTPYYKPGIRHIARLDEIAEYSELAEVLMPPVQMSSIEPKARIPAAFPYFEDGERRVGVQGGCGCYGSACPGVFDGTVDCYPCPSFTAAVEGPHEWVLKVLVDRQADMIAKGLPGSEWTRYNRHIAAVGHVIRLVEEWKRKNLENL